MDCDPWRLSPLSGRRAGSWAWPVVGRGEGSGALRDTALSLSPGSPAHPPAPRPRALEGPREKAGIRLSPHSLPREPCEADGWRNLTSSYCANVLR